MNNRAETDVFHAFVPPTVPAESGGGGYVASHAPREGGEQFVVSPKVWEAVMQDLGVREEWESRLQKEIEARVVVEREQARAEGFEAGRKEGVAIGVAEGKTQLSEAVARLESLSAKLISEKQELLVAHERTWCHGMHYLLRRFLVDKPIQLMGTLEAWISECIEMLPKTAQVKLKVSAGTFAEISALQLTPQQWKIEMSPELAAGEVKCVFEGGEIFFSGSRELERLEEMLAQLKTFEPGATP